MTSLDGMRADIHYIDMVTQFPVLVNTL
jgi:hypothetical protein